MGTFLKPEDLSNFADIDAGKAADMIEDAEAQAQLIAPCIADLEPASLKFRAVKAILRAAVLRWNDAGAGALTTVQQGAGPYQQMTTVDNSKKRVGAFWPSEIERLQDVCRQGPVSSGAYMINMTGLPGAPSSNPLYGATVNAPVGGEPQGEWSDG